LYREELTMGLDLALGVVILICAFRGWFRGFTSQAVRIGGVIACVYLADPVRDYAKPRVLPYLPKIPPELVDPVLWWVSAVLTFVVLVGLTTLVIKMSRRPEIPGLPEPRRNDQFAGLLLGLVKGALIAVFLTAGIATGIQKFAPTHLQSNAWAEDQAKNSRALKWNEEYQPALKIWNSQPVTHFRNHIQRMGFENPTKPSPSADDNGSEATAGPPVQTASRTSDRQLERPDQPEGQGSSSEGSSPSGLVKYHLLDPDLAKAAEDIKQESKTPAPDKGPN
jgi:uncharacterized membrane protein required for colicin V production